MMPTPSRSSLAPSQVWLLFAFAMSPLVGCAYTVSDWWEDVVEAECRCNAPQDRNGCEAEALAVFATGGGLEGCADEPAPVAREDVRMWRQDYLENCILPAYGLPTPTDPDWLVVCE